MQVDYEQVKAAVLAIQNPAHSKDANEWLMKFQKTPESWTLSDRLLREPNSESSKNGTLFRQWGGKMLHSKIQRNLDELSADQIGPLTQSLLAYLMVLAQQEPLEINVCRCVCLCIAALAVQMNQAGVVQQILLWLNPLLLSSPRLVLELLAVLPEECENRNIDITRDQREAFLQQLTVSVTDVFTFLSSLWGTASINTKNDILRCVERWIDLTDTPGSLLNSLPIFVSCLDSLIDAALFESAADVTIMTIKRYNPSKNIDILHAIVPRVIALRRLWTEKMAILQNDFDDDEALDACRVISRVFSELGERYISLIFSHTDIGQGEIIPQLLDCARIPHQLDISTIPIKFFFDLGQEISIAESRPSAATEGLVGSFRPVFLQLLEIAFQQVELKAGRFLPSEGRKADKLLEEEEYDFRSEWRDVVVDCTQVLGGEAAMSAICSSLQQCVAANDVSGGKPQQVWAVLESRIWAAQMVAPYLPESESVLLPWLIDFISRMPDLGPMLGTIMELVGRLSRWLAMNPSNLPHFVSMLGSALRNPMTCSVAARSLKSILADCYRVPGLPLEQMHDLLLESRSTTALPLEAELDIIEGFRKVIVNMAPGPDQGAALQRLIEPIVQHLATELSNSSTSSAKLIPSIERLTCALRYDPGSKNLDPATLLPFFIQSMGVLQQILEECPWPAVAEKVCRCYKHMLRNCQKAFLPYLPAMCEHLSIAFHKNQHAAFIYAGSVCVSDYGNISEATQATLYEMIWGISRSFFAKLNSLSAFIDKPDVVEEYYFFIVKVLKTCPGPLLCANSEAYTLITAAITGLQLEHREAHKGILGFFDELLNIALGRGGGSSPSAAWVQYTAASGALVLQHGSGLAAALMLCLSGMLPAYVVADTRETGASIVEVLYKLRELNTIAVQVSPLFHLASLWRAF